MQLAEPYAVAAVVAYRCFAGKHAFLGVVAGDDDVALAAAVGAAVGADAVGDDVVVVACLLVARRIDVVVLGEAEGVMLDRPWHVAVDLGLKEGR